MKTLDLALRKVGVILPLPALPLSTQAQVDYAIPYTFVTVAGLSPYGSADGTGGAARFSHPGGMTFDSKGNAYVADTFHHTLRKMSLAGEVTTLAGTAGTAGFADGTGPAARFNQPWDLEVDGEGNLYVADTGNHLIRKVTPAGEVTILGGSPLTFGITGLPGLNVDLESSSDLAHWQAAGSYILEGGTNRFVSSMSPQSAQFFRAHVC